MAKQGSGHVAAKPKKSARHLSVAKLSPEMIKTMSVRQLRRTLPRLSAAAHAREAKRPAWWPHLLPWTHDRLIDAAKTAAPSALRTVAKKCCKMLKRRSGKRTQTRKPVLSQPRVLDWINSQPPSRMCVQPVKASVKSSPKKPGGLPYLDIYLCHLCNAEFSTKDTLQKHQQVQCQEAAFPSTPPVSEAPSPAPVASTPEDSHSASVASSTAPSPDSRSSVPQNQFIAALDLVPFYRARKIRQARRRNTECETIDLEEPQTPVSPSTPRSHKFLITQLSRDPSSSSLGGTGSCGGLASRRSSCLRLSLDKRPDNVGNDKEEEQREGSDRESSESGAEDADEPKLRKKTLFSIDVSSMLGQRIIKHMTSEVHVPVISDAEEFCRTPIKDKYQDRLRIRQTTYPVTWKLTRKRQQQFHHLYKFTRADKWDFKETMRTGLNRDSRKLQDSLPKCSVVVKRLSTKTLLKWNPVTRVSLTRQLLNEAKTSSHQPSVFPKGPTFLLTDVDRVLGLKRKDVKPELTRKLLASHCVSENANAEMQSQKLTVYRCLLTDLYSSVTAEEGQGSGKTGATSKNKEKAPRTKQKYPALLSILSGSAAEFKHPFQSDTEEDASVDVQKPLKIDIPSPATGLLLPGDKCSSLDDSFSVRTVSSDEDIDKNFACCTLCTMRNKCKCTPKKSVSAVRDPATSSPAHSLKKSSLSKASLSPPQLDPLSLTPKVSVSSHNSLSPPNLSPVSQVGEGGPQSPSVAHRLSTRRSTLLLRTASSSFPKGLSSSCSHEPQAGSSQYLSAPSPSHILRCKRGNSATWKQTLSSPTPAKKSRSSPVLSASSNLLQPMVVSDTQRRHTRSSSKQNEPYKSVLHQTSNPKDSECSCGSIVARQSSTPTNSVAEIEPSENPASPSNSSPSISSFAQTDDKNNTNGERVKLPSNPTEKTGYNIKSSSCTGNAGIVGSRKERREERLNVDVETTEGEKKQAVQDKMQTRGSLRESNVDRSQRSGQREDSFEYRILRSKKGYDAGDTTAGAGQKIELTKSSLIKESGKVLKNKAEAAGRKDKISHEDNLTAGDGGDNAKDRDTNSGRTLRNRDRKLSETEINQRTSHRENSQSVPDINKLKASKSADHVIHRDNKNDREVTSSSPRKTDAKESGIRKLRSSERNNGSAENSEKTVAENILQVESEKNIGLKANGTKAIKVANKLRNKANEQVQNQEENTETRNGTDGNNMNSRDSRENGTICSSETSCKTSKDVLTAFSKAVKNYEESKDKKKSVDTTEGKKVGSRKMDEQDDNVNKNADSFQLNTRKNASSGGSSKTSVHSGQGKEQVAATDQTRMALPRRVSSRKSVADARGEVSLQVTPKKKIERMVEKTCVSSPNGEDAFHPKNDEQKLDACVGSVESRGVKTKLTSEEFGTQENGFDSGINSAEHVNPFLNSRAQTRFFSSHIKEQIHRTREQKLKMTVPKASKNKLLKSGNTFGMAHISFDTLANAVSEKSKGSEKNPFSSSLNKWPFTAVAASTGPEVSPTGAVLSASSSVDTTRMHLSPKQMLSVLESSKRGVPPSKDKAKKEASTTDTGSPGSPARHTVHSSAVTRTHPISGLGSSVNQKPLSAENMDISTPVRNAGIQKTPVKSKPDQGAFTNQKIPATSRDFRHQTKVSGERPSPKTPDIQGLKTKVAGKRPGASVTGKRGSLRKKLCV